MSWKKVKIKEVLKQYRVQHIVQDSIEYKQVSILNDGSVVLRGNKIGKEIGRKRQFKIDLRTYPDTLIFTRQLLLQGSIGIASEDVNDCIVTENMPMFSIQTSKIDKEFLILFLKSEVFKSRIRKIELSGSAQKSIHEKTFLELEFLIPDIDLQKNIVVELLKLKSNGDTISSELTHQLDLIKQLRQAFLREAMQGKLVTPATLSGVEAHQTGQQLLAKIKAEKAKLIAEKKLKKEKELPPITEAEIPFEIPEHWAWCKIGDLTTSIVPNRDKPLTFSGDITWVTQSNFSEKSFKLNYDLNTLGFTKEEIVKYNCRVMPKGSIIMSCVGRFDLVCLIEQEIVANQQLHCFVPYNVEPMFLVYAVKLLSKQVEKDAIHTTIKYINKTKCESIPIPLPPLHEQEQIVAKLEELTAFCDGLEQSIKESQGYNEMLLQQVLREALQGEATSNI
jgi:type I restriction enzyme S subunit